MPNYSCQVTLFPSSNVIADAVVNTFSFSAVDDTVLPDIATALIAEYNGIVGRFPSTVRQNNHKMKFYDRADVEPRAPRLDLNWNFTVGTSGNTAPPEVAVVLSFQANQVSGIPQSRRRGRVYFGPLKATDIDAAGRPSISCVNDIANFGDSLLASSMADPDWEWVVWSSIAGPSIVTNGWVDDEFDTQRRRGRIATTRVVWS